MWLLLQEDKRTEIMYNEVIGRKRKPIKGQTFLMTLKLYDEMETFRKQKVRVRVKLVATDKAIVEVF